MNDLDMTIKSRLGDYQVRFQKGYSFIGEILARPNTVLVMDRRVYDLYRERLPALDELHEKYLLDAQEENKTLEQAGRIVQWIVDSFTAKKNINYVSIGGGITQDVSGFVASTLYRGVPWTFVPTTLLAQCDSCIGGKTSINFGHSKNLLGTFYPPREVHINADFTNTLSDLDRQSGFGEVAKFLLMDAYESGFDLSRVRAKLQTMQNGTEETAQLISDSLKVKRKFMENDEFDRGRRNLLNYGHCFGHALEAASDYYVPHGVAVAIGMIFANFGSVIRGLLEEDVVNEINEIIKPLIRQPQRAQDYLMTSLFENLKKDKKRVGSGLPLVCPTHNELVLLKDFTESEFVCALERTKEFLGVPSLAKNSPRT